MLIINRYTCPITGKVSIQAHEIKDFNLVKSYGKMTIDDITIFSRFENVLICDVVRASNLPDVQLLQGVEL